MSEPTVWARGLSKVYESRFALRSIDLEMWPGQVVVLLGPNGAGKSTLIGLFSTLSRPSRGELRLFGLPFEKAASAARGRIGLCAHATFLYEDLTARENLELFARLHGLPKDGRIDRALDRFGLGERAPDRVRTFSRGMLQRLALARTLLPGPELLLLDEPTTGLDQAALGLLCATLREARDRGALVVVATHDFAAASAVADRVLVLSRGRITADGPGAGPMGLAARYAEATAA
jgi:heme exporter protein A